MFEALNDTTPLDAPCAHSLQTRPVVHSQAMHAVVSGVRRSATTVTHVTMPWTRTLFPHIGTIVHVSLTRATRRFVVRRNWILYGPDGLKTKLWELEDRLKKTTNKKSDRINRRVRELSVRISHLRVLDALILSDLFVQSALVVEPYGFMVDEAWHVRTIEKTDLARVIDRYGMVGVGSIAFKLKSEPDLDQVMLYYPSLIDERFGCDRLLLT